MEVLKNNIPLWLQCPTNYYKTTGKNFRFEIFRHIAGDHLTDTYINLVSVILNLFQLSIIMLDDIFDKTVSRRGEPAMHTVHGTTLVSAWAIGISHYIYQIITDNFKEPLSTKFSQLYNEVGIRTLRGQCYELTIKDYKEIVKYKTTYYTVGFPVAVYLLLKTGDLKKAMDIMEDPDLLELGYLFQAENDFNGNFEKDNTDIEMRSWTILIDMASKKIGPSFVYPESREKAKEIFEKHNILNEYVRNRENGLDSLRQKLRDYKYTSEGNGEGDDGDGDLEAAAKYGAIEFCMNFFEGYKYKGYISGSRTSLTDSEIAADIVAMNVK